MLFRFLSAFVLLTVSCAATRPADLPPTPVTSSNPAILLNLEDFSEETVTGLITKLGQVDEVGAVVMLRLDTYGGSVHEGQRLMRALESMKYARVQCVADTKAMSMGMYLLQSPGCDERLMTRRAMLMMHEPLIPNTGGNEHALREDADYLRALTSGLVATAAKRMKKSEAFIRGKISNRNWYLDADEALKMNAVDRFVEPEDLPAATALEIKKPSFFLRF